MRTLSCRLLLYVTISILLVSTSWAQTLYATGESVQKLFKVDMSTGDVTPLTSLTGRPDSLIVDSSGRILFTTGGSAGTVSRFDPSTGLVSVVASGLSYPRDLIFDPGQATILVSNFGLGQIVRISLGTGTVTPLISKLGTVDGLAYDAAGHLFAVVGHHKQVIQINPSSGAILKTLTVITNPPYGWYGLDGLTYDSYTGRLWASDVGSGTNCASGANCLVEIPTDLSSFTFFQAGAIPAPDGVVSDGKGSLFIGAGAAVALEYNIPTDTVVKTVKVPSIDDVALAPANLAF
jgi:sugar lactone lactonase YvrE